MRRGARLLLLLPFIAIAGLLGVAATRRVWREVRVVATQAKARHTADLLVAEQNRRLAGFRAAPDPLLAELATGRITAGDPLDCSGDSHPTAGKTIRPARGPAPPSLGRAGRRST